MTAPPARQSVTGGILGRSSRPADAHGPDVLAPYLQVVARPPLLPDTPFEAGQPRLDRNAARLTLPPPRSEWSVPHVPLQVLSDVLHQGAGFTRLRFGSLSAAGRHVPLKRVPSGGGFHPVEVYILQRGVPGVPEGTAHYDPLHHQLEWLEQHSHTSSGPAQLTLILTAATWKSVGRYQEFAYRLHLLDVGVVAEHMTQVALALGVQVTGLADATEYAAHLGLDTVIEPPLVALHLTWGGLPVTPPDSRCRPWTPSGAAPSLGTLPLASAVQRRAAALAGQAPAPPLLTSAPALLGPAPLDPATLLHRRSAAAGFTPEEVPTQTVQELLAGLWPAPERHLALAVVLAAGLGLEGPSASPEPRPATASAHLWAAPGPLRSRITSIHSASALTPASAPLVVYVLIKLDGLPEHQPLIYRTGQIQAGQVIQRLCLRAAQLGLASHITLAYDAQTVRAALALTLEWLPAACVAIGRPRAAVGTFDVPLLL